MLALLPSFLFLCACSIDIISIQAANETYFAYLPLSPDCNYSPDNQTFPVEPPSTTYTQLDPQTIFRLLQESGELAFWGIVRQGIIMLAASPSFLANSSYQQILLYDSPIQSNFTSRQFILPSYGQLGQIIFQYALPYLTINKTLQTVSKGNSIFFLGERIESIVRECENIEVSYAGGNTFIGVCVNTTKIYAWNASNAAESTIYAGIPLESGDGIAAIAANPQLLVPAQGLNINSSQEAKLQPRWNVVLLSQQGEELFCWANLSSISCESYLSEELWVDLVIERSWGAESALEIDQIELVLAKFPSIMAQPMPGQVVSVFAFGPNIEIEWVLNSTTFLTVYIEEQLIINTTLNGAVVAYGQERIITQNQMGFWIVQFSLPYFSISSDYYNNTQAFFSLDCSANTYQYDYRILWSNFLYPLFQVNELEENALFSDQAISLERLDDYFQVIGPAFNVFINDQAGINIDLLDIEAAEELGDFLNIVAIIESSPSLPLSVILINIWGKLISFNLKTKTARAMNQPCGLQNLSRSLDLKQGYLFIAQANYCYCSLKWDCSLIQQQQIAMIIYKNSQSAFEYRMRLEELFGPDEPLNSAVKLQLTALVPSGYLVTIFTNNTVVLQTTKGQFLYSFLSECAQYNATWGAIFQRDFEDDFLILYCSSSTYLTQLLIRNAQLIPFRSIPLYGFLTKNQSQAIIAGSSFLFLEVALNPLFFGDLDSHSSTGDESCCILRLNPSEFTVSVIVEIMLADNLVGVYSFTGADVVIYNQSEVSATGPALKVYFQTSWIGFQEEGVCSSGESCGPTVYPFSISFVSVFYNFAATYMSQITFDTSASSIRLQSPQSQQVELVPEGEGILRGSTLFEFGGVTGPVGSFRQHNTQKEGGNIFSIDQNKIITQNKEISSGEQPVLQVLDLAAGVSSDLENFIMVVGQSTLWIYQKYGSEWLQLKSELAAPQPNCFYSAWSSINGSLTLIGNCFNANQLSPLLTLAIYTNSTNQQLVFTLSNFTFPAQLRAVSTILSGNASLLVGILSGPANSIGGVLALCTSLFCSSLNITSKLIFFIDYDQQTNQLGYIVAGLDVEKICFWINPSPSAGGISADATISYRERLNSSCSKVKIVSWTTKAANIILSCSDYYQQLTVDLSSQTIASLQTTFTKFTDCQAIDSFKPQFILAPNSQAEISILTIECSMNAEVIRFQQITAYGSNSSQVVTGYLQVFTSLGPKQGSVWWPVRLIDLGTAQLMPTSLLYSAGGQLKIVYETIDGILVDNFVDASPITNYVLLELTKQVVYPVVKMVIQNPYYKLTIAIKMQHERADGPFPLVIASFIFFLVFNLATLIFFICWCVNKKPFKKRRALGLDRDHDSALSSLNSALTTFSDSPKIVIKQPQEVDGRRNEGIMRMEELSNTSSYNDTQGRNSSGRQNRPRGTQIELFQPR